MRKGVHVRLGDDFAHEAERKFLQKLRRDLTERSIDALIFANFITPARQQRQVDFLIVTDQRCVHLELKSHSQAKPLLGPLNGKWQQIRPDGSAKDLGGNYYAQTRDTKFAISDSMREAGHQRSLPQMDRFFTGLDCVLCIDPAIPHGSKIDPDTHTTVIGYDSLLARLQEPGPRPPWNEDDWDAYSKHLGTYPESDDAPATKRRRSAENVVDDYRASFAASNENLHERIPIAAAVNGEQQDLEEVPSHLPEGSTTVILAPSGWGKTHLAQHTAVQLSNAGDLVVWARADDYTKDGLHRLLARAIAPHTTQAVMPLLDAAQEAGRSIVIFLDNFSGCAPPLQQQLVENLAAFRLRAPAAALVLTASRLPDHLDDKTTTVVRLQPLNAETRQTVLDSHGLPAGATVGPAFQTPYELKLAALCFEELTSTASQTDLLDVYIRRVSGRSGIRRGLHHLAGAMDAQIRVSLTWREAQQLLERVGCESDLIDAALASPLLVRQQGRVRFVHELIGRLLAAEHIVQSTGSGTKLGHALREHSRRDLREHALRLESDATRCVDALRELAEPDLFASAGRGGMGPDVRDLTVGLIKDTLGRALAEDATLPNSEAADWFTPWTSTTERPPADTAMLQAVAQLVLSGYFVSEVRQVLDHTDALCRREMQRQKAAGQQAPISLVVASTYGAPRSRQYLPAGAIITAALETYQMNHRTGGSPRSLVNGLLLAPPTPGWGRVYAAALIARSSRSPDDLSALPDLLEHARRLGGYHLQLACLMAVQFNVADLEDPRRARIVDLLHQLLDEVDPMNIGISSTLIEILASLGEISPGISVASIQDSIETVFEADPLDPYTWDMANGFVSSIFEDERIIGPYGEAVAGLDAERRIKLYALAIRSDRCDMFRDWVTRELVDLARANPTADIARAAILDEARAVPESSFSVQNRVASHVEAVCAWALLSDNFPSLGADRPDPFARAWDAVDQLTFATCRQSGCEEQTVSVWWRILRDQPAAALEVLYDLDRANYRASDSWPFATFKLRWTDELRQILTWGLQNRTTLPRFRHAWGSEQDQFIISVLGAVGDESTLQLLRSARRDCDHDAAVVDAIRALELRLDS
ncbi:NERD domain-containing protein [Kribbella sp. NPDC020789]